MLCCKRVGMIHNPAGQRTFRLANSRTVVRHGASRKPMRLQKIKRCQPGVVQAHTGIIEHAELWARFKRIARRTQTAM